MTFARVANGDGVVDSHNSLCQLNSNGIGYCDGQIIPFF